MNLDLFSGAPAPHPPHSLYPGAFAWPGFALDAATALWPEVQRVLSASPLRHLHTPSGLRMSVAMSNCGALGWVSDAAGYRYEAIDPQTQAPWPEIPAAFLRLAQDAAHGVGYPGFVPDACLINRYAAGARMTLHQDRNELDLRAPIVSVSLGLPAVFLMGGLERSDSVHRVRLHHGDVVVWGGASRLRFHGVLPVDAGEHPVTGAFRFNLTFRKAG